MSRDPNMLPRLWDEVPTEDPRGESQVSCMEALEARDLRMAEVELKAGRLSRTLAMSSP